MTPALPPSTEHSPSYLSPDSLGDYLSDHQDYCLFLDIDGTLADFTLDPKASFIPSTTLTLLKRLQDQGVIIAAVTGRSLSEARQMLAPIQLPIAATHGLEIAFDNTIGNASLTGQVRQDQDHQTTNGAFCTDTFCAEISSQSQPDLNELAAIKRAVISACSRYFDFIIEDKPYSVALHYRQNPNLAKTAHSIMSQAIQDWPHWTLKQGKFVWEALPKCANKGSAILTLLNTLSPQNNLCPIFIGDDLTDEAGFMAVQKWCAHTDEPNIIAQPSSSRPTPQTVYGLGIKVGAEPTCARFYVHDISEVTELLANLLRFYQDRRSSLSKSSAVITRQDL